MHTVSEKNWMNMLLACLLTLIFLAGIFQNKNDHSLQAEISTAVKKNN